MRRSLILLWLLAALAVPARSAPPAGGPLVTPAWLAERLDDPSLVVLHVAALRADYDRGHVPGARFLWLNDVAPSTPAGSFEMPCTQCAGHRFQHFLAAHVAAVIPQRLDVEYLVVGLVVRRRSQRQPENRLRASCTPP